jgi:hypothetical protein
VNGVSRKRWTCHVERIDGKKEKEKGRVSCSGLWRCIDLALADVSEEHVHSIFRVHIATSQKTTFFIVTAVKTSNLGRIEEFAICTDTMLSASHYKNRWDSSVDIVKSKLPCQYFSPWVSGLFLWVLGRFIAFSFGRPQVRTQVLRVQ